MNTVVRQFAADLQSDLLACQDLIVQLKLQFEASVSQQTARLNEVLSCITELLAAIELRRQRRVKIVQALSPADPRCAALIATFPAALQSVCRDKWQQLEMLLQEARQLNLRNGEFILSQQEIMQRVLFGEQDIYDPL